MLYLLLIVVYERINWLCVGWYEELMKIKYWEFLKGDSWQLQAKKGKFLSWLDFMGLYMHLYFFCEGHVYLFVWYEDKGT